MNPLPLVLIATALGMPAAASARDASSLKAEKIAPLPRELEIQVALSALPPHLRDGATVYVLNADKGFEQAIAGKNGFHTFVARTGEDTMRGSWRLDSYRDDILYPVSFDAAGAKAHMRVFFDIAEMQAKGTPPNEVKKTIQKRYKKKYYKPPERAGLSYMVSPILRTYANPEESGSVVTTSNPHVMHYGPNISNEDIGGSLEQDMGPYAFVTIQGPHGFVIQHIGRAETAEIVESHRDMLSKLCALKQVWCLPKEPTRHH